MTKLVAADRASAHVGPCKVMSNMACLCWEAAESTRHLLHDRMGGHLPWKWLARCSIQKLHDACLKFIVSARMRVKTTS